MAQYVCQKCMKTMDESNFYTYHGTTDKVEICKKCLTMHVDNFDEETYLWILEKLDVPYIKVEWNDTRDKAFAKNPKLNGMSVLGRYLSKMKLKQHKDDRWADSDRINAENEEKAKIDQEEINRHNEVIKQKFENGEINEAQYRTLLSTPELYKEDIAKGPTEIAAAIPFSTQPQSRVELPDPAADLTEEDIKYLAMKWGTTYTPADWVQLESTYVAMTTSFDIQDADTINTLIAICKTNLKMNQAIDIGDLDGFQKLSKVYESLRKSAKFTAAQNKEEKGDFVDSVGELVAYCEKESGAIPKYELNVELDIVDKVINDLKSYTKGLITEDKALARQIEDYLKKREIADQQKEDRRKAKELGLDEVELDDEDYEDYIDELNEQKEIDSALYEGEDDE